MEYECSAVFAQGTSQNENKMITKKKRFLSKLCSCGGQNPSMPYVRQLSSM